MQTPFSDAVDSLNAFPSIDLNWLVTTKKQWQTIEHKIARKYFAASFRSLNCSMYLRMDCSGRTELMGNMLNLCCRFFLATQKILAELNIVKKKYNNVVPMRMHCSGWIELMADMLNLFWGFFLAIPKIFVEKSVMKRKYSKKAPNDITFPITGKYLISSYGVTVKIQNNPTSNNSFSFVTVLWWKKGWATVIYRSVFITKNALADRLPAILIEYP